MPRWLTGPLAFLSVLSGAGGAFLLIVEGLDPVTLTVAVVAILLGIGTLDRLRTRVTLQGEEIVIVRGFNRRRLFRGHVDSVHFDKRSGLSLQLEGVGRAGASVELSTGPVDHARARLPSGYRSCHRVRSCGRGSVDSPRFRGFS